MAGATKKFELIGTMRDGISPKLKSLNTQLKAIDKNFGKINGSLRKMQATSATVVKSFDKIADSQKKMSSSIRSSGQDARDYARNFGRVTAGVKSVQREVSALDRQMRDLSPANVKVNTEGVKEAQSLVTGLGRDQRVGLETSGAEEKIGILGNLIASEIGGKLTNAFQEGFGRMVGLAQSSIGMVSGEMKRQFGLAADDELDDLKQAGGVKGSLEKSKIGKDVTFSQSNEIFRGVSSEIARTVATSTAPTKAILGISKSAMDSVLPIILAELGASANTTGEELADLTKNSKILGTKLGFGAEQGDMSAAQMIAKFAEMGALYQQGSGSDVMMAAQVLERAITMGTVEAGSQFIDANNTLKGSLEDMGFMGKNNTMKDKTPAERFKAVMTAMSGSMDPEMITRMGTSFKGVTQAFNDVIKDGSTGLFGLSVELTDKQNEELERNLSSQYAKRRAKQEEDRASLEKKYQDKNNSTYLKRRKEIDAEIKRLTDEEALVIREAMVGSPFQALVFYFSKATANLTGVFQAIGPIFGRMAPMFLNFSEKVFGPLELAFKNIGSDARAMAAQGTIGFQDAGSLMGRVFGEIGKAIGRAMNINVADPKGPIGQFMEGFKTSFFQAFGGKDRFKEFVNELRGVLGRVIREIGSMILSVVLSDEFRPILLGVLAWAFGPPILGALLSSMMYAVMTQATNMVMAKMATMKLGSMIGKTTMDVGGMAKSVVPVAKTVSSNVISSASSGLKSLALGSSSATKALVQLGTKSYSASGVVSGMSKYLLLVPGILKVAVAGVGAALFSTVGLVTAGFTLLLLWVAALSGGFGNLWSDINNSIQFVVPMFMSLWEALSGFVMGVWNLMVEWQGLYTKIRNTIMEFIGGIWTAIGEILGQTEWFEGIAQMFGGALESLTNMFKITEGGVDVFGQIMVGLHGVVYLVTSAFNFLEVAIHQFRGWLAGLMRDQSAREKANMDEAAAREKGQQNAANLLIHAENVNNPELRAQRLAADKSKAEAKKGMKTSSSAGVPPSVPYSQPMAPVISDPSVVVSGLNSVKASVDGNNSVLHKINESVISSSSKPGEPAGSPLNTAVNSVKTSVDGLGMKTDTLNASVLMAANTPGEPAGSPLYNLVGLVKTAVEGLGLKADAVNTSVQAADLASQAGSTALRDQILAFSADMSSKMGQSLSLTNNLITSVMSGNSTLGIMDGRVNLISQAMEAVKSTMVTKTQHDSNTEKIVQAVKSSGMGGFGDMGGDLSSLGGIGNLPSGTGATKGAAGPIAGKIAGVANGKFGLTTTSGKRNGGGKSLHDVGRAMDFSNGSGQTPQQLAFHNWALQNIGGGLKELIYSGSPYWILGGRLQENPREGGTYSTHHNHVHVGWAEGNLTPLKEEMRKAPSGAKIGYANSSETILNRSQTSDLAGLINSRVGSIGPIHITIGNGWSPEDAEGLSIMVAEQMVRAVEVRKQSSIT